MASTTTAKQQAAPPDAMDDRRGRDANTPTDVPKSGWLDILSRTKQQLGEDNLTIVSAGVAFYAFVAVVPALAATVAIYGLVADPSQVTEQVKSLGTVIPGEALPLLEEQMVRITSNDKRPGLAR